MKFVLTLLSAFLFTTGSMSAQSDPVLVGAGDVASCDDLSGAYATAKLIEKIPGTVIAVGDLAYEAGTDVEFKNCYGPKIRTANLTQNTVYGNSWSVLAARTHTASLEELSLTVKCGMQIRSVCLSSDCIHKVMTGSSCRNRERTSAIQEAVNVTR